MKLYCIKDHIVVYLLFIKGNSYEYYKRGDTYYFLPEKNTLYGIYMATNPEFIKSHFCTIKELRKEKLNKINLI